MNPVAIRRLFHLIITISLLQCFGSYPRIASAQNTIPGSGSFTVTGVAPVASANRAREAKNDAFRKAIEEAAGTFVKAETWTKNLVTIKDKIYTHTEGYVKSSSKVSESVKGEFYYLTLRVEVATRELNKDCFLLGIPVEAIYDWLQKPRILVAVPDYIQKRSSETGSAEPTDDGFSRSSGTDFAQSALENSFLEKGITVVDQGQIGRINKRDAALAYDDESEAVALGNRFGADIVVTGKCQSFYNRAVPVGNFQYHYYSTVLSIRIYQVSTAKVILSKTFRERNSSADHAGDSVNTGALGEIDAAFNSIENIIRQNSDDILFGIVKKWYDAINAYDTFTVTVSGLEEPVDLEKLEAKLRNSPGIIGISRHSYQKGIAELEIDFHGIQSGLDYRIRQLQDPSLNKTREEYHRLFYQVVE